MKTLTLALSTASLVLLGAIGAGAVIAQDGPGGRGPGMGADRTMTWADFKTRADEGFARLDANHDGVIDQSDREAMHDQMRSHMFDSMDSNHDGSISRQEFDAAHGPDGPPMPGDMAPGGDHHGGPGRGEHRGAGMGGAGMGGGQMGGGQMGGGMGIAMMFLHDADTNHDGKITRAEYDASVKMHFDAMDTNHDRQISKDERKAARAKMRGEMQSHMGGMRHGADHGADHGSDGDDMPPPAQ